MLRTTAKKRNATPFPAHSKNIAVCRVMGGGGGGERGGKAGGLGMTHKGALGCTRS